LPYLDRCLKESLRLYPSVFFILRLTSEEVTFQKKYVVPAGTPVHLNIYAAHRDSNFWPDPEVFDPDRFLPERSQNRHPYSYLPFSAGPRNCIGKLRVDLVLRSAKPLRIRFVLIQDNHGKNIPLKFQVDRCSGSGCTLMSWYFIIGYVVILNPHDIQTILKSTKHNTKGILYKALHLWLGDGLLVSKVFALINCLTHKFAETSMGTSLQNIDVAEQERYRNAIHVLSEILFYRIVRLWYHSEIVFWFSSKYKEQVKCLKILHGFTEKIIAERKRYHESTGGRYLNFENTAEDNDMIGRRKKRLAMMDLMIAASNNNQMSDSDIREEVDTFVFEGHDTIAMELTFAVLLLAEHKDVQDRVKNEVNDVMEENGGKLTMTALQNLPYLERCLKETMRLYPIGYFIGRKLEEDVMLQSYLVPAGTEVTIDIIHLHQHPDFWPNPKVFDPDRFLPELVQNRHPFAYIPFSVGSRNCIGQRFVMMELKTVIGTLVHTENRNWYLGAQLLFGTHRSLERHSIFNGFTYSA
ncbi:Cytochrome P450 4C1, partial [Ooceraea biroi]